ncbi:thiamine pyrophosphate-binding protein [Candidatus Gottesmanbacteria bacterium]|nr:thiamine pyrophosphate-binding protein [Candidatus Gottesmanbacteria bacterium]
MKLSDYIAEFLVKHGIRHVFVVSGGAAVHMIDSIARHPKISYICTQHEQAAGTAADGYARVSDNLGAVMVTSGPGPTNLVTAVVNSYYDSVPVILLCGQVATFRIKQSRSLRQKGFQETDIVSIFKSITKYTAQIRDPDKIRYELEKSVFLAKSDRKGPVVLDIPDDLQRAEIEPRKLISFRPDKLPMYKKINNQVKKMLKMIKNSRRPLVIMGAGVHLAGVRQEAVEFLEKFRLPAVFTWGGKDLLPSSHPLNMGGIGVSGPRCGNFTAQTSDLVIAIGTRLSQLITGGKQNLFAPGASKIMVDIDEEELDKFTKNEFLPDLKIHTDLPSFFDSLTSQGLTLRGSLRGWEQWLSQIRLWRDKYPICPPEYYERKNLVNPYVFVKELSRMVRAGAIIFGDTGANLAWTMQTWEVKRGQRIISAWNHTPMGYSLPASIGGAVASNKDVICLTGDGGLMMTLAELATVVRNKLPIKIFIFNNHCHGIQKQTIDTWLDSRYNACDEKTGLSFPDFIKVGKTFNLQTLSIVKHSEINAKIKKVLKANGPVLCNVEVIKDQKIVPYLKFGAGLEDLDPKIPKEELMEVMRARS